MFLLFGIVDKIKDMLKEILIGNITANFESMFGEINNKIGSIATDVGQTPMGWNKEVYNFIKNINDDVIIPIAGLIITAVLCIELIQMVMERNNMQDADSFELYKYVIKAFVAVYLASHAFEFSMAVFDVAQTLVNKAAGVVGASTTFTSEELLASIETLKELDLGKLFGLVIETTIFKGVLWVVGILINIIIAGRMFEIYVYSSISSIPFATMGNKEWGQIGINYIKGLFALGLQGLFLMICLGIYNVLIKTVVLSSADFIAALSSIVGFAILLGVMMLKSGSISKSVMNAN